MSDCKVAHIRQLVRIAAIAVPRARSKRARRLRRQSTSQSRDDANIPPKLVSRNPKACSLVQIMKAGKP